MKLNQLTDHSIRLLYSEILKTNLIALQNLQTLLHMYQIYMGLRRRQKGPTEKTFSFFIAEKLELISYSFSCDLLMGTSSVAF